MQKHYFMKQLCENHEKSLEYVSLATNLLNSWQNVHYKQYTFKKKRIFERVKVSTSVLC